MPGLVGITQQFSQGNRSTPHFGRTLQTTNSSLLSPQGNFAELIEANINLIQREKRRRLTAVSRAESEYTSDES